MTTKTLHRGRFFPELESKLLDIVLAEKAGDPLRPVVVLVGSNLLRTYLQRKLGIAMSQKRTSGQGASLRGHIGVTFLTFRDLADRLIASGDGRPPRVTTSTLEQVLIEGSLNSGDGMDLFGPVGRMPGFPSTLHATLTTLDEACITLASDLDSLDPGPKRDALAAHLTHITGAIGSHLTIPATLRRAAEHCDRFESAFGTRRLIVYGIYDLTEAQKRLISGLVGHIDCDYLLPSGVTTGLLAETEVYLRPTLAALEHLGFLDRSQPPQERPSDAPAYDLIAAADPEHECIAIVRSILDLLAKGVSTSDIAVALRHKDPYMPILTERLRSAGLPYRAEGCRSAASTATGRAATLLLRFALGGGARTDLIDYAEDSGTDTAGWESLTRLAMITRWDGDTWKKLRDFASRLQHRLNLSQETLDAAGSTSPDPRMVFRMKSLTSQIGRMDSLIDFWRRSERSVAHIREQGSWSSASTHLRRAILPSGAILQGEKSLDEALVALSALDDYGIGYDLSGFASALQTALDSSLISDGRFMSGVTISEIERLRGMSFKYVFVPGLTEDSFPAPTRQDPLLLDDERRRVNAALRIGSQDPSESGPLPLASRRSQEELLLFDLALNISSVKTTLLRPAMELSSDRICRRSWLLDAISTVEPPSERPQYDLIPADASVAISPSERALADSAQSLGSDVAEGLRSLTRFSPASRPGIAAVTARESSELSEYDGYVGRRLTAETLTPIAGDTVIRATTLESYAECPLRFMLARILGIEAVDKPEELETHDPRTLGTAVHAAFKRFYESLAQTPGALPLRPDDLAMPDALLRSTLAEELELLEQRSFTGYPAVWTFNKRRLINSCSVLLAEDAKMQAETSMSPALFEHALPDDFEVDIGDGDSVRISGRIDRVDLPEGAVPGRTPSCVRVIDYKGTVKPKGYKLTRGTKLQPALYLSAALTELGADPEGSEARYAGYGHSTEYRISDHKSKPVTELLGALPCVIGDIVRSMRSGLFTPNAAKRDEGRSAPCGYCDLVEACRANEYDPMQAKRHDDALSHYQHLSEVE